MALSRRHFDTPEEALFREWFQQAALIVKDIVQQPGALDLPPLRIVPPEDAMTDEPVGVPNRLQDQLRAFETVKHKVGQELYDLFLRVHFREKRGETIDEIARDYGMDAADLLENYSTILRILKDPFES